MARKTYFSPVASVENLLRSTAKLYSYCTKLIVRDIERIDTMYRQNYILDSGAEKLSLNLVLSMSKHYLGLNLDFKF